MATLADILMRLVLLVTVTGVSCIELPPSFKRCRVSADLDNKPNECLKASIQDALTVLGADGLPELGVPDFDPLDLQTISVQEGQGPLAMKLNVTGGKVYGYSKIKLTSINGKLSSPKDFQMVIKYKGDEMQLSGLYTVDGRVLILPIRGSGSGNMTLKNVKGKVIIKCEPQTKNGKEYLKVIGSELNYEIGKIIFNVENLFNGNQILGEVMNQFLNDNWYELFQLSKGTSRNVFSAITEAYAKTILERVEFKKLFIID